MLTYLDAFVDIRCNLCMCCLRIGLIGCVDEIAHNALAVYWNPYESPAKVRYTTSMPMLMYLYETVSFDGPLFTLSFVSAIFICVG